MTAHQIVITISPTGEIKTEVQGVSGPACGSLSAWVDKLGTVTEDRKTPDFYKPEDATLTVGTGG